MLFDRVKCTIAGTDNTGGVPSILLGAAVPGFRTFAQAGVPDGALVSYTVEDGNAFEVGTGRYSVGANSLVRVAISSNSNNDTTPINLSTSAVVFTCAIASDLRVGRMAGEVKQVAFAIALDGWAECNGQALSRATYPDLFARIGTVFGAGDGNTTFNVPDYRDRFAIGAGGALALGQTGGAASTVLTAEQAPPIKTINNNMPLDTTPQPEAGFRLGVSHEMSDTGLPAIYAFDYGVDGGTTYAEVGNSNPEPVPTLPPFLALRYLIALTDG